MVSNKVQINIASVPEPRFCPTAKNKKVESQNSAEFIFEQTLLIPEF